MNTGNLHLLSHQPSDLLMQHKNPMLMRLQDAHHQNINVGDLVDYQGHNSVMDRQRFKVVMKMQHPDVASAIKQIDHSGLDVRDRIKMKDTFLGLHGPEAASQPVVSLHLEPHPMGGPGFNRSVGSL